MHPRRSIYENRDIFNIAIKNNLNALIISINQIKALDCIERNFLYD